VLFGRVRLSNILIRGDPAAIAAQAVGAACFGFGHAALRMRIGTVWPLVVLHMLTDLFLQIGRLPLIPMAVVQDLILLGLGVVLLRQATGANPARQGSNLLDSAVSARLELRRVCRRKGPPCPPSSAAATMPRCSDPRPATACASPTPTSSSRWSAT
jgi:hypothetical protein